MYVAVFFRRGPRADDARLRAEAHRDFVTSLIRRNSILCGGEFADLAGDFEAAYVLRVDSLAEAQRLVAEDPYFAPREIEPVAVEWRLIGVNPDAIDAEAVLRPSDV